MKIVQKSRLEVTVTHTLVFLCEEPGCGFAFDCTEDGEPLPLKSDAARSNYELCLAGRDQHGPIIRKGVETSRQSYRHPAIGLCSCGRRVELADFTNTCACGIDYNFAGQALAPRSCWGEETGESWSECY